MTTGPALFTAPVSRTLAAIGGTLVASVAVTAGMPLYLPFSQTDNIGLPIVIFPVTWLVLFLYSCLCRRAWRAWALLAGLTVVHAALIYGSLA